MTAQTACAGIVLMLLFSGPASAQTLGSGSMRLFQPGAVPPQAREVRHRLGPSAIPILQNDAPGGTSRGLIGSWPITAGLSAGLGLLEVNRDARRERALRRLQPMKDVGRQTDRIAAIGLNLSF